eukprot:COSAG01_NODE_56739_length_316_cov_1.179724_1_plen_45_part_01
MSSWAVCTVVQLLLATAALRAQLGSPTCSLLRTGTAESSPQLLAP